jgi:hypothetical protein
METPNIVHETGKREPDGRRADFECDLPVYDERSLHRCRSQVSDENAVVLVEQFLNEQVRPVRRPMIMQPDLLIHA